MDDMNLQAINKKAEDFSKLCSALYVGMHVMGLSVSQILARISTELGVSEEDSKRIYESISSII